MVSLYISAPFLGQSSLLTGNDKGNLSIRFPHCGHAAFPSNLLHLWEKHKGQEQDGNTRLRRRGMVVLITNRQGVSSRLATICRDESKTIKPLAY